MARTHQPDDYDDEPDDRPQRRYRDDDPDDRPQRRQRDEDYDDEPDDRPRGRRRYEDEDEYYDDDDRGEAPPPNYLVQSILVTFCCCTIGGIIAIVNAAQVNSKWQTGDYAGAQRVSDEAKKWCWISFGVGIVINLFVGGIEFAAGMKGGR